MLLKLPSSLLFFLLLLFFSTAAASVGRPSPAKFQYLDVKSTKFDFNDSQILHTLNFSDSHRLATGRKSNHTKFKLNLVHRDKLSHVHGHHHGFDERIKRDAKRVATLVRRLSHGSDAASAVQDSSYKVANFATDVISGKGKFWFFF